MHHPGHPSTCLSPGKAVGPPPSPINSSPAGIPPGFPRSPPARPLLRRGSSTSASSPKVLHSPKAHSPKVHPPPPPLQLPHPHMYFQAARGSPHLGAAPGPMTSLPMGHHSMLMPPPRQVCLPFEKPVTVGVVSVRHAGGGPSGGRANSGAANSCDGTGGAASPAAAPGAAQAGASTNKP
ncbi:hypothetical protein DUNSADRAFT_7501 [Dunaliella salina]|uniref:Encoded protein n=1 Tax=Dunaliella salina TaxID=3046 RepID=A0ABQ7GL88_DUNSA|nr:hypothetical protein DUNSADRAFT_7501 [Dunaliella salina]|eukprot:KAF5835374.1 hypothetical protein DUNSADRAFT_7501 [Dunaliella salina]